MSWSSAPALSASLYILPIAIHYLHLQLLHHALWINTNNYKLASCLEQPRTRSVLITLKAHQNLPFFTTILGLNWYSYNKECREAFCFHCPYNFPAAKEFQWLQIGTDALFCIFHSMNSAGQMPQFLFLTLNIQQVWWLILYF